MVSNAPTSLAPGFRFHPTDEELVRYYLRRKIFGKPFRLDAISEIDIYKTEPWDLPSMSKLKTRDLEWYFFSVLDKKYGNGLRTNRATEKGYWKTTGKDRAVLHRSQVVGMKKTLVYHFGRAPKGQRTNWVMHEYRHIDEALNKAGFVQDSVVLCRVFQKSGPGPKNGEQYGAPLIEEDWEDDEFEVFLKAEAMEVGEDAYLDETDIDQILGAEDEPVDVPLLQGHNSGEGALFAGGSTESVDDSQKFVISLEDYTCEEEEQLPNSNSQKLLDSSEGCDYVQDQLEDNRSYNFSDDKKQVKHEYIGEEPNRAAIVLEGVNHKNDEQYVDASDNFGSDLGTFFENDDLLNPLDADTSSYDMLDEYLVFSNAIDGMTDYITFDSQLFDGSVDHISREIPPTSQDVIEKSQPVESNEQPLKHHNDASSSKQAPSKYRTDFQQHPFMKQASQMLMGNIQAPPAFASEFPSSFNLKSVSPASSPVHVTAGMIQIRDSSLGSEMVHEKDGLCNITFSFGMSRGDDNSTTLESVVRILPGKAISMIFGSGSFYLMLISILVLSMSCKIGSLIFAQ